MPIDKSDPTIKEILSRLTYCEGRIGGGKVAKGGKTIATKPELNEKVKEETTPPSTETAQDASGDAPAPDAPPPGNTGTETAPPATETAPPATETAEVK